jgi:hypothetical protein
MHWVDRSIFGERQALKPRVAEAVEHEMVRVF